MVTSVGRPLEFDPDTALDAAMQVFWSNGYEYTSVHTLLNAMDISKSSLYQAFGGKQALYRRCMTRYADQFVAHLQTSLDSAPSGRQFITDFLNSVLTEADGATAPRGCMVMNSASEFAQKNPDIAQDVTHCIGRFHSALQAAVQRAQREGDISLDQDAAVFANFLVSSMSGLKIQAKAGASPETLKGIIEITLKTLG